MNQETAVQERAEEILRVVDGMSEAFQSTMTDDERAALDARRANEPEAAVYAAASPEEALIDFTIGALGTLIEDMQLVLDGRMQSLYRQALDVYYAAEELARDPQHAHLAAQVEAMRLAHQREYGHPPPPRARA